MNDLFSGPRSRLSPDEQQEFADLRALVSTPRSDGSYPYWSREERDRVRELIRKADPTVRFAPSTEEIGRRFGAESHR